jgi:hypothetical protein
VAIAYAIVSAARSTPPTDAQLEELGRPEPPKPLVVARDGLVGWWRFDEMKGTRTADSSGNELDGDLKGGPAWVAGKLGGALSFDGEDDNLPVWMGKYIQITDSFTVAFWANPAAERNVTPEEKTGASGTGGQRYLLYPSHGGMYGMGPGHTGAGVSVGTNGISVFEHADNHLPSLLVHNTAVSGWTHVAVVFSNKEPKLYVNGQFAKTGFASTMIVHPSLWVGGEAKYGAYKGGVDDLRLYNRALTAAEVAGLHRGR